MNDGHHLTTPVIIHIFSVTNAHKNVVAKTRRRPHDILCGQFASLCSKSVVKKIKEQVYGYVKEVVRQSAELLSITQIQTVKKTKMTESKNKLRKRKATSIFILNPYQTTESQHRDIKRDGHNNGSILMTTIKLKGLKSK